MERGCGAVRAFGESGKDRFDAGGGRGLLRFLKGPLAEQTDQAAGFLQRGQLPDFGGPILFFVSPAPVECDPGETHPSEQNLDDDIAA